MNRSKRISYLAALTALSLMINIAESALPPLFVPGARLGLSNLITLFALFTLSAPDALLILIARTLLSSLFTGVSALMFSLPAGLIALGVSIILKRFAFPKITVTAISVSAAVLHNITQNLVFCLISKSPAMLIYTPYLALTGVLAGVVVGLAARILIFRLGGKMTEQKKTIQREDVQNETINSRINIQGIGFDNISMADAVGAALMHISEKSGAYAVTPNPEIVWLCRKSSELRDAVNSAELVLADGIGIILAAKIQKTPLAQKLPGIDFACNLISRLAEISGSVYLLGAKPKIASRAGEFLIGEYPGLIISGLADGYFTDDKEIISDIREKRPDLLLVCLGSPKQELFISKYAKKLPVGLMIGLGGSLDVFAGEVKRAPIAWQKLGIEWLYRLIKEPRRLPRTLRLPLFLLCSIFNRKK